MVFIILHEGDVTKREVMLQLSALKLLLSILLLNFYLNFFFTAVSSKVIVRYIIIIIIKTCSSVF